METKEKVAAAINMVKAVADAIKDLGRVPSGTLYAALMPSGIAIDEYNGIIGILKRASIIREEYHELVWNLK